MTSALSLLSKAESYFVRDLWAEAHTVLLRARRASADPFLKAEIMQKDAEALRALGRFRDSLACFRSAHTLYTSARVPSECLSTLLGASACLRVLGRYPEARRLWSNLERTFYFRAMGPALFDVELERALVARGQGRFQEARFRIARALRGSGRSQNPSKISHSQHAHWILGGIERFSGHFSKALRAFKEAVRLARMSRDVSSEAYALFGLAGVQRVLGWDRASLLNYRSAHRVLKKIRDPFGEAYGLCGQANAHRAFGDAGKSLPLYRRSVSLYRRLGDESSEGFAHWGLGGSFRRLHRPLSALSSYTKAFALFRKSRDDRGLVMAYLGKARLEEGNGRTRLALREAGLGLSVAQRAGLPYETALARYEIGRMLRPLSPPYGFLGSMGISPSVLRRWRDIP